MRTFTQWLQEVRPMPGKGDWTDLDRAEPLRDTDTVRVYHGFRDFNLALRAISKGISGQEVVGRVSCVGMQG